jgi:FMN reductase
VARILAIGGSRSPASRTRGVLRQIAVRLQADGHDVACLDTRDLPAAALLSADATDPDIRAVVGSVAGSDALVVATPVYNAAYSGLLKALLDLLPRSALAGKAVLPIATGGTMAHVLAIDYALRPVLMSLGAAHVAPGYFLLDRLLMPTGAGDVEIDRDAATALFGIVDRFSLSLCPGTRCPGTSLSAALVPQSS